MFDEVVLELPKRSIFYSILKLEQYTFTSKTLLEIDLTVLIDLYCSCFILLYLLFHTKKRDIRPALLIFRQ